MNELLITIMLAIPAPDKMVNFTINQVPTQIQVEETTGRVCVPKNDHSGHVDLYLTKD